MPAKKTITDKVVDTLKKEASSFVKSQARSALKKKATAFIGKLFAKSEEELQAEVEEALGYKSLHFQVKNNKVEFKSSPIFIHEWLTNSPLLTDKIIKDEESNQIYFEKKLIDNTVKVELINQLVELTKIKSIAINGHFDNALKLLTPSDYNAVQFKEKFSGWDPNQESVIDRWMDRCFGSALMTNPDLSRMLFRKWIVGTARRAIQPGSALDGCLTFSGPAGAGKTQFFRQLIPAPFSHRTGEIYCDVKSPRQMTEAILGKTIANFDELSVLNNEVVESFKMLLTAQNIDVRLAYKRDPQRYALRQGFGATTNQSKFILDSNMSRRLWVLELNNSQKLDFDFLQNTSETLWKEAVFCALRGDAVYLSSEQQHQVEENNKKYLK